MQVYKDMAILTQSGPVAKPPVMHLVSFLDSSEEYNAALFRKNALFEIEKISNSSKIPLLTVGTGLYFRALMDGLFEAQTAGKDDNLREKLVDEERERGKGYLHTKLEKVDEISASKIHVHDTRRIVRALEVFYLTQKPMSAQKQNRKGIREDFFYKTFVLNRDRQDLYGRINRRVDRIIDEGLVDEVKGLLKKTLDL